MMKITTLLENDFRKQSNLVFLAMPGRHNYKGVDLID